MPGGEAADEEEEVCSWGNDGGSWASDGEGDGVVLLEVVGAQKEVGGDTCVAAKSITYKKVRNRELDLMGLCD